MKDFATRFHLRYPDRAFEITPWNPDDAPTYFGNKRLSEELKKRIEAGYTLGRPPKIYLHGRWGAGKTHHLYHFKNVLETQGLGNLKGFVSPYLQIECDDGTEFQYLHRKFLDSLGITAVREAVTQFLMKQGTNRAEAQREMFGGENLIIATQVLSIGDAQLAWRWLCGEQLSVAELRSLNVTAPLTDTTQLVDVLVRIGRLLASEGKRVLFLIDEGEGLKNVAKPNAQRSWHDGFRSLADNMNNSVGYVMGIFVDANHPSPEFINEEDIIRRMGQRNIVTLEPYSEPDEIMPFLTDLLAARIRLAELADLPADVGQGTYPFTDDGLDLFVNELLHGAVSATPHKVIEGVSECAWEAHIRDLELITVDVVREVMPRVTAGI